MKWYTLQIFFIILFTLNIKAQSIRINEVSFKNKTVLEDTDGDTPDWFEIFNNSSLPINLQYFKVTDDTSKAIYWEFPEYIIDPGQFLIVFASNKSTLLNNEFHTSFSLDIMKDTLYLLDDNNHIIEEIIPGCVPPDLSLARVPDGSDNLVVVNPTPGATNNNSLPIPINYIEDSLIVNINSGFYSNPINIILSNSHPGNRIYYTLNGNFPEEDTYLYEQPLFLDDISSNTNRFANEVESEIIPGNLIFKGNILRAMVYSSGCPTGNEIANVYFIHNAIGPKYSVPVVSLITDKDNLFDDEIGIYTEGNHHNYDQHGEAWERLTHLEIFDSTGMLLIDQDAGIRIHGRGSRRQPQKSFRLYAENEYGKASFNYPLFSQKPNIDNFKILLLRTTAGTLGTILKEELCNSLVQDMNIDYQAGETVILFINGEYWGIYNLMERQNKYFIENNYNVMSDQLDIVSYDRILIAEEGTLDEYYAFLDLITQNDPESDNYYELVAENVDIAGLIDYYIAQFYFANYDWPGSNLELWKLKSENARWRYFFFDSDAAFAWVNYDHLSEYNNSIEEYQHSPEFALVLLKNLLKNNMFREEFYGKFYSHLNTTFKADRVISVINHFESLYSLLIPDHVYRWHNPVDYRKWKENIDWIKLFAIERPLILTDQLQRNFGEPFVLFPNPSDGNFSIRFFFPISSLTIKIWSIKGQLLGYHKFTNLTDMKADVNSGLPQGLYLIQFITNENSFVKKLIVQ